MKQRICVEIDTTTYLEAKKRGLNLSQITNILLKRHLEIQDGSEIKIQKEITDLLKQSEDLQAQIITRQAKLKEMEQQSIKAQRQRAKKIGKFLKTHNPAEDLK